MNAVETCFGRSNHATDNVLPCSVVRSFAEGLPCRACDCGRHAQHAEGCTDGRGPKPPVLPPRTIDADKLLEWLAAGMKAGEAAGNKTTAVKTLAFVRDHILTLFEANSA